MLAPACSVEGEGEGDTVSESIPATGGNGGIIPVAPQELAVMPPAGRALDVRHSRVMPLASSILWTPAVGAVLRPGPPMFVAQHTLRKIHDRLASLPNGLGMGLLAGRQYTCSGSGAQFVMIDGALPLPSPAADDEPIEVLAEGIRSAAAGVEILGWYRGRPFGDAVLTPADVEAQTALFEDRPCIIAVVAGAGDAGAIFRHSMSPGWPLASLPFYEWLGDHVVATDEPKPSILGWRNYRPSEPVVRASAASPSPRALHTAPPDRAIHPVLVPDADGDEEAPRETAMYSWVRPLLRPAGYAALVVVAAVLITGAFALFGAASSPGSRNGSTSTANVAGPAPAVATLDRRADTLALALNVFQDRARMFDARQMPCSGLARGLQQVEDGWLDYNLARKETLTSFDPAREARDRALYADVRTIEQRFQRSGCPRP